MKPNHLISLALALVPALAAGCASGRGGRADSRPIAKDPVCQYYRELGCVDVRVDDSTPRAEYKGVTYYFCCEHCKEIFEEHPEDFAAR